MTNEEEEKRHEEILKSIKKKRRRSFKFIEWKILAFVVATALLFVISYAYQNELERFLNPVYYSGAEHNEVVPLESNQSPQMKVHFIDVGCADATFIELPNNKTMLIDCAGDVLEPTNSVNALLQYLEVEIYSNRQNKVIDYLFISHPDKDHYLGAKQIFREYDVKNIVRPIVLTKSEKDRYLANETPEIEDSFAVKNDSSYDTLIAEIEKELASTPNSKMHFGMVGLNFFENDVALDVIGPNNLNYEEKWNNYSSCLRIEYAGKVFLFTGDAEKAVEKELIETYSSNIGLLNADILKIAHHGSETSGMHTFYSVTSPDYCVIPTRTGVYSSVPATSVIENLSNDLPNALILRTDINGNVVVSVSSEGNIGIYTTRGSFDFVTHFVFVKLYYVLITIAIMLFILIFQFRGITRADILEMREKKYAKELKRRKKLEKKRWKIDEQTD